MARAKIGPVLILGVIAAVAVYFLSSSDEPGDTAVPFEDATPMPVLESSPAASDGSPPEPVPAQVITREIPGEPGGPPLMAGFPLERGELSWEKRIRAITENPSISKADKARILLSMIPGLPPEGHEAATDEALRRLSDRDYQYARSMILNPTLSGPALQLLWADLMERPDAITLPLLVEVAKNPGHPFAISARENLELLLGQNFGTDWGRWELAVQQRLAEGK